MAESAHRNHVVGGAPPTRVDGAPTESELALDLERDDGAEQRDALDERGEDQRRRLDAASRFRLALHALDRLAADAADADAGADDGEAGSEAGTHGHQAARARGADVGRGL